MSHSMTGSKIRLGLLSLLVLLRVDLAFGQSISESLELVERFQQVYVTVPVSEQEEHLVRFLAEAETNRDNNSLEAEAWIACALIRSAYLRTQGLSALSGARKARREFETAIELEPNALGGYAQAFLGRLYLTVPGWPVSYGSDRKAEASLTQALAIDSQAAANNYYFALFLIEQKQFQEAEKYLLLALSAPPRLNLPWWDASITRDIEDTLQAIADDI